MEILVKLGKSEKSDEVRVKAPSVDCTVAEVLADVRRKLPPMYGMVLRASEQAGSTVFLALDADGPEPLAETKCLKDYIKTGDNCTLWLMCAPIDEGRERE